MIRLPLSLAAWQTPEFKSVLKREIEQLDAASLPLDQALSRSSHVSSERVGATILHVSDGHESPRAKAGLFFTGIIAGCSCADDPTPVDDIDEYCEVWIEIDRGSAEAVVRLLDEE